MSNLNIEEVDDKLGFLRKINGCIYLQYHDYVCTPLKTIIFLFVYLNIRRSINGKWASVRASITLTVDQANYALSHSVSISAGVLMVRPLRNARPSPP